jgi:hypothetical protein
MTITMLLLKRDKTDSMYSTKLQMVV